MAKYNKTAKDLAFDRERARLKNQIEGLREDIRKANIEIDGKVAIIDNFRESLAEAKREIQALKKLIEIPEDQMERYLKDAREAAARERRGQQAVETLEHLFNTTRI